MKIRGFVLSGMALLMAPALYSQTGIELDSILVTAQKREESAAKIPFSITVVSAKQVKEYRLWNSKDITAIVPNLYAADPGDDRNVTGIRGIATTSYNPAVATYIDGVNQFGLDSYISQLLDIERIEILRGPQGTLYGRNAMGGVINIITRPPADTAAGFAEMSIGNYGRQRYTAGVRTPLVKGKIYLGVAGVFDKLGGYYFNKFDNSDYDRRHSFTGNYYLKYKLSDKWIFSLNAKHHNNRNRGAFPLVAADPFEEPFVLEQNALTKMIDNTLNLSLTADHKASSFNFSSQTAYQSNYRYYTDPIDGDFSPLDAVTVINNYGKDWNRVGTWTQEFKFNSTNPASPLKWIAGTYLFYNNSPVKQATHYGEDAGIFGVQDVNFSTISSSKARSSGIAFYGQVSSWLSPRIELVGGARFDYESQRTGIMEELAFDGQPSFVTRPDTTASTSFNAFSPKLALNYTLSSKAIAYGVYSRGFRTGGLTQLSSDPNQPPLYAFGPEYSNNFEAGIKHQFFSNRLQLNMAAFYTIVNNTQVPTLILPEAITLTRNSGRLINKGVELELAALPFRGWLVNYNAGYTHSKFDELKVSADGGVLDYSGKRQIFTPDITSMLAVQYMKSLWTEKQLSISARVEWRYLGNTWFNSANTIGQSPYNLYNASIGFNFRQYGLMFWGRNLTDRKYVAYAYDFGAQHLGNPLTQGLTLSAKF